MKCCDEADNSKTSRYYICNKKNKPRIRITMIGAKKKKGLDKTLKKMKRE